MTMETMLVNVHQLELYHRNPRKGSVTAVKESLAAFGQVRTIVVNLGNKTGRPMEVLAGNHTLLAARELGWDALTCTVVDVDDETAARIVLADNRTSDLGRYDNEELLALLQSIENLEGTGYEMADVDDLAGIIDSLAGDALDTSDWVDEDEDEHAPSEVTPVKPPRGWEAVEVFMPTKAAAKLRAFLQEPTAVKELTKWLDGRGS